MSITNGPMRQSGSSHLEPEDNISTLRSQLLRYCEFLSGSLHDAEDLAQTTLLKALPVLRGEPHPNITALLRRIAKNTWIDHVRKQSKHRPCCPRELEALGGSVPPRERLEVDVALQALMQRLTSQQQAVFLLCEVFEYTNFEVAELLGISSGAVKATLHRANARFKSILDCEELSFASDEEQKELLQAYVVAFHDADIRALIHLCQGGMLDPVQAVSKVLTFSQKQTTRKNTNGRPGTSMFAAA